MAGRNMNNPPRHKPPRGPGHGAHAAHPVHPHLANPGNPAIMSDMKAKTVLKEAVDAVVNSFAKHTHGYGRGGEFTFEIPFSGAEVSLLLF